ncbi:CoA-binding protein [Protomyces lactucae-debilis]|uniref:CoA-binding protein n=1 Tax=Protomyces lactucae-debilis TaxID=2754530 RepID=A0A1Y2F412_PROLT|nr:CoA-binding protein [Protomyces lactucae-debilis]ORY77685.1 CoA-binding protein [Protomyces lactucae-debilis]
MSANSFFLSKHFAVVGASADTSKFGNKLIRWYQQHDLPVSPINPRASDPILGLEVLSSVEKLPAPRETSVSVVVPPAVTLKLLDQARDLGIRNLWLQPGSFDDSVMARAKELSDDLNVIAQGRCILVEGSEGASQFHARQA